MEATMEYDLYMALWGNLHCHTLYEQVLVLDLVPPENIPGPIVPRVQVLTASSERVDETDCKSGEALRSEWHTINSMDGTRAGSSSASMAERTWDGGGGRGKKRGRSGSQFEKEDMGSNRFFKLDATFQVSICVCARPCYLSYAHE